MGKLRTKDDAEIFLKANAFFKFYEETENYFSSGRRTTGNDSLDITVDKLSEDKENDCYIVEGTGTLSVGRTYNDGDGDDEYFDTYDFKFTVKITTISLPKDIEITDIEITDKDERL